MSLYQEACAMKDKIIADRRYLHQHPELGLDLPNTANYVEAALKEMGYEPKRIGACGVVAIAGKKPGKCFLIRGDMDALPITEQADVDFKSLEPGKMHACGHDCHTANMLAAARLLKAHEDELEGQVKLMFQPAEETMDGAKMMVEGGVLENPHVDAAMGIHVFSGMPLPAGTGLLMGVNSHMGAVDWFTIHITGKGCHGASPNAGIDPLNVMSHIHLALQAINAREMDPSDNLVLTIGQMHGGDTSNVIPNEAMMSGTIRTLKNETRTMVKERMEAIVSTVASAFRAEAHVEWGSGCPVLGQDRELYYDVKEYGKTLEGVTIVDADEIGAAGDRMGSEDFAYVAEKVPTVFLGMLAGNPKDGYCYGQHHPMVRFDESALPAAAALYAHVAIEWLKHHK